MNKNYKSSNKTIITNWGKILLDTSFIIKVINYAKYRKDANKLFFDLMSFLADNKYQLTEKKNANREFLISAISIAEIMGKYEDNTEKSKIIAQALNAKNITIIDFDEDSANIFNNSFHQKIGKKNQKEILVRWGEENSKNNREALTNDLMILASGICNDMDTIICVDKGMYKIGMELGLNMVFVKEEYFNKSEKNFFTYYSTKCNNDLKVSISSNGSFEGDVQPVIDKDDE